MFRAMGTQIVARGSVLVRIFLHLFMLRWGMGAARMAMISDSPLSNDVITVIRSRIETLRLRRSRSP